MTLNATLVVYAILLHTYLQQVEATNDATTSSETKSKKAEPLSSFQIGITAVLLILFVMLLFLAFFSCFRTETEPKFQKGGEQLVVAETKAIRMEDPNAVKTA